MQARARVVRRKRGWNYQSAGSTPRDEDRFGDAIERHAVEGTADAIGPEQRRGREKAPERIH